MFLQFCFKVEPDYMMFVAACAVAFNIILGLVLHGICKIPHSHGHGGHHGHSHKHHSKSQEHLTSTKSGLHSDSESDIDDLEKSNNEKRVREISIRFGNFVIILFYIKNKDRYKHYFFIHRDIKSNTSILEQHSFMCLETCFSQWAF